MQDPRTMGYPQYTQGNGYPQYNQQGNPQQASTLDYDFLPPGQPLQQPRSPYGTPQYNNRQNNNINPYASSPMNQANYTTIAPNTPPALRGVNPMQRSPMYTYRNQPAQYRMPAPQQYQAIPQGYQTRQNTYPAPTSYVPTTSTPSYAPFTGDISPAMNGYIDFSTSYPSLENDRTTSRKARNAQHTKERNRGSHVPMLLLLGLLIIVVCAVAGHYIALMLLH
jgi:hypothetical protein